jgi:small subunit ribosomal protein S2
MQSESTVAHSTDIERLFSVGAHFGVGKSRRHPSQIKNIFTQKDRIDVFDLEKTFARLEVARAFATQLGSEGKHLLFIGGKPESAAAVKMHAERIDAPYCVGRWIGGTLTNVPEIHKRVERLEQLRHDKETGALEKYTKLERVRLDREAAKLEAMYGGIVVLNGALPHALFVIDPRSEQTAIREAQRKNIPVIALANSDCNIEEITYPIPANDATAKSIAFFTEMIADAYAEGKKSATRAPAAA